MTTTNTNATSLAELQKRVEQSIRNKKRAEDAMDKARQVYERKCALYAKACDERTAAGQALMDGTRTVVNGG